MKNSTSTKNTKSNNKTSTNNCGSNCNSSSCGKNTKGKNSKTTDEDCSGNFDPLGSYTGYPDGFNGYEVPQQDADDL